MLLQSLTGNPLPHMLEFSSVLHVCTVFLKINLVHSYYQIPFNSKNVPKTAVTTPFRSFKFLSILSGLQNAASTFQHFIDEVVQGMDFIFIYVDNILIICTTIELHQQQLTQLFQHLHSYKMKGSLIQFIFLAQ